MIWHIFKKDLKVTWPLAVLVAGVHWITPVLAAVGGLSGRASPAVNLLRMLVIAGPLASGFLITVAVHLDAIPGVRQDWLVRPIRRGDLMIAKLLFAAIVVQLPILLANTTAFLIDGRSLSSSLGAAAQHSILQMCVINPPFVALASMTRNFLELVSGGVALGIVVAVMDLLAQNSQSLEPLFRSGLGWILYFTASAIVLLGALLVLRFQYFSRRTTVSWTLAGIVTVLFLLTWAMPWRLVFAIQRSLSSDPASSQAVTLGFDLEAGKFQRPSGGLTPEDALTILLRDAALPGTVPVYLPLRVAGLPADSAIQMDHAEVRIAANGRVEKLEQEPWNTRRERSGSASTTVYPPIAIPAAIYERIKDQRVRVEVDYWLTLAEVETSQSLPAMGGDQELSNIGRCRTRVNDQQTAVQYTCTELPAACLHSFLEYMPTGQRNPARFSCGPYASIGRLLQNPLFPARLMPSSVILPFRDQAALAHFPVDGSKLRDSQAVLQLYRAQDHFTRTLAIPGIRLGEWEATAPGN